MDYSVAQESVSCVFENETWWSWSPSNGARTNAGRENESHGKPAGALLDPFEYLGFLRIESIERSAFLGRTVFQVRATPRQSSGREGPTSICSRRFLATRPDDCILIIDAERGGLLRLDARIDGLTYQTTELTKIIFDERIPPHIFTIELPPGENFSSDPLA